MVFYAVFTVLTKRLTILVRKQRKKKNYIYLSNLQRNPLVWWTRRIVIKNIIQFVWFYDNTTCVFKFEQTKGRDYDGQGSVDVDWSAITTTETASKKYIPINPYPPQVIT